MDVLWSKLTGKSTKDEKSTPAERHRSFEGNLTDVAREELYAVPRPSDVENPALKGLLRSDSQLRNIVESDLREKKKEQERRRLGLAESMEFGRRRAGSGVSQVPPPLIKRRSSLPTEVGVIEPSESQDEINEKFDPIPCLVQWEKTQLPPSIQSPSRAARVTVCNVLVLYNPFSGAKKGESVYRKASEQFRKAGVRVQAIKLERRGHAEELCRTMDLSQFDVVVPIGGDGTIHECVNGLMKRTDDARSRLVVSPIPAGTGNSFVLELQGSVGTTLAVQRILRGVHVPIDIFKLNIPHKDASRGNEMVYCFNSLHWGLASKVNVTAEKLRWMGKAARYTTAAFIELFSGSQTLATILMEDADGSVREYHEEFSLIIANNIKGAAKGMQIAPNAKLNDGLIDLLLIRSDRPLDLLSIFDKFYKGTHIHLPFVEYRQVRKFSITPYEKRPEKGGESVRTERRPSVAEELVDVDGELKGSTPLTCEACPGGLRFII